MMGAAVGADSEAGLKLLQRGYRLVIVGSDATLLRSSAAALIDALR
jgi:2-keto-3-deoxy-L-rhamnonate aldolase RhmA